MNREEFTGYLESRALEIPLHREGELLRLPREFHHAVAVTYLLDALGQPAPTAKALRTWYGQAASASPETARWVLRVVGSLENEDLKKLHVNELMAFSTQFDVWGGFAHVLANRKAPK